ncbi:hypothetical protein HDV00_009935 [Rhizophlyctis rosea]|nr:hypothetical protein HDV00_009935 [Rhizophlyctis rosea]
MLDRPLYKRIAAACAAVTARNERIFLSATIHDVRVTDVHIRFGPEISSGTIPAFIRSRGDVTVSSLGSDNYLFNWYSLEWIFPKEAVQTAETTTFNMAMGAMDEGTLVRVEAIVDADIVYRHSRLQSHKQDAKGIESAESSSSSTDQNDHTARLAAQVTEELTNPSPADEEILKSESVRREILVQFTSPHITVQNAQDGGALAAGSWRISDVDFLMENEVYQRYREKERERDDDDDR